MRYQTQTLAVTFVNFTYIVRIFTVVHGIASTAHKLQYDDQDTDRSTSSFSHAQT